MSGTGRLNIADNSGMELQPFSEVMLSEILELGLIRFRSLQSYAEVILQNSKILGACVG